MAKTYTPNLRLVIDDSLTADARANLLKIDALALGASTDLEGSENVRSSEDINLLPQDASVGGAGFGGAINLGSLAQAPDTVTSFASATRIEGTLDLQDVSSTHYLKMRYVSATSGAAEAVDTILTLDVSGSKSLILNADLATGLNTFGVSGVTYTLPGTAGALADTASVQVLQNKIIDSALNTVTGLTNATISASAAISYSKLNLTGQILVADLNPAFTLPYSKLVLSNAITNSDVNTNAGISYNKLNLTESITNADLDQSFQLDYTDLILTNGIVNLDISTTAAIDGYKIVPEFGTQFIKTDRGVDFSFGSNATRIQASASQSAPVTLVLPLVAPLAGQVLTAVDTSNLAWTATGAGTVSSVDITLDAAADAIFSVTGGPITSSGVFAITTESQAQNTFLAAPAVGSGQPSFRTLSASDIPNIDEQAQDAVGAILTDSADVTLTYLDGVPSITAELVATGVVAGSYGDASNVPTLVVDTNGRITSATDSPISISAASVTGFDEAAQDAVGGILADSADLDFTYSDATPSVTAVLTTTAVTPGSFGSASSISTFTVDSKGRLTAAGQTTASITTAQISDAGAPNGVATLDGTGKVPAAQLPSYVDDVLEFANLAAFPVTGETGVIYVAIDTGFIYRWSGSIYVEISTGGVNSVNGLIGVVVLSANATWTTGTTYSFVHGLGSVNPQISIIDLADNQVIWVDSIVVTDSNTVDFTSTQVPSGSGWKVIAQR